MPAPSDLTGLLVAWSEGDQGAFDRLIAVAYGELRRQGRLCLRRERAGHTLQPTALVHEAFFRLVGLNRIRWQNRAQFFAVASRVMRRVLVDHARARASAKRGAGRTRVTLHDIHMPSGPADVDVLALDQALEGLAALDPRQARVVELRYFGGLTAEETARSLGISVATVDRDWAMARAWLFRELGGTEPPLRRGAGEDHGA